MTTNAINIWLVFIALLIGVRFVFAWFNRLPNIGHIVPMLILQLARSAGYLLIFTTSITGVLFCVSQALSKWIPYLVYRVSGSPKLVPNHLISSLLLLCFMIIISTEEGFLTIWGNGQAWIIYGYSVLRAVIELKKFIRYFKPYGESTK